MPENAASNAVPSQTQLQTLAEQPAGRGLLLQYHIAWRDQDDIADGRKLLRQAITAHGGVILSAARVDLLAIGNNGQMRDEIWLAEFTGPARVDRHLSERAFSQAAVVMRDLEILVASTPSASLRRAMGWLNRLLPLLPAPHAGKVIPEEELSGGINPTAEQFRRMQAADQDRPIHMFNLLAFHPRARYGDGDRGRSGRQAYADGYGRVAMSCVLRLGGRIVMLGRYRFTLLGRQGDPAPDAWDEIAVIQYPKRPAFVRMLAMPKYIRALAHRHAGLAHTEVWSATPLEVVS